ncbi:hypothetical protein lerEdw1_013694 [Lerista edwardsae]|nr:hypothetical protein lerEdw1_013694 [Lerista edwardsae]
MLSAASQLSFKGAIETMLTWKSSKSSKPEKILQESRGIFSVIVTPDRIPQFCIPSLEVDHFVVQPESVAESEEKYLGTASPRRITGRPRPIRSKSEPCARREGVLQETWGRTDAILSSEHSDPVTRAALSLPHLPKITTPYGFLTLGESPNIRRKESLFFGYGSAEFRILLSQKKEAPCPSQLPTSPFPFQSQSRGWEKSSTKTLWPDKRCNKQTSSSFHCNTGFGRCTNKSEKKRFQLLMKKHLPSVKKLRSNTTSGDRSAMHSGKSLNKPVS